MCLRGVFHFHEPRGLGRDFLCLSRDGRDTMLKRGENLIGRSRDCVVRLESIRVSRHHARITVDGDAAMLEDCGSRNGTAVGGQKIEGRVALKDGDDIAIAGISVWFRVVDDADATPGTEWA